MSFEWLVIFVLAGLVLCKWGDLILSLAIKLAGFFVCLWLAAELHSRVAQALLEEGLLKSAALADVAAFAAIFLLCLAVFSWIVGQVRRGIATGIRAVGLDVVRVALVLVIVVLALATLFGVLVGKVIALPILWIVIAAAVAAILDEVCPKLLSRVMSTSGMQ